MNKLVFNLFGAIVISQSITFEIVDSLPLFLLSWDNMPHCHPSQPLALIDVTSCAFTTTLWSSSSLGMAGYKAKWKEEAVQDYIKNSLLIRKWIGSKPSLAQILNICCDPSKRVTATHRLKKIDLEHLLTLLGHLSLVSKYISHLCQVWGQCLATCKNARKYSNNDACLVPYWKL